MWRAFFFAVGTILILLGLQCLTVDKFYVTQTGRLGGLANKALNVLDPSEKPAENPLANNLANPFQYGGSAYGPSRFQASPYTYSSNPGYGSGASLSLAGYNVPTPNQASGVQPPREFPTQDWMPWSLLAAGSIIVLYTKSTRSNGGSSGE